MTFLPIVERELRVAARRAWTYHSRFIAAVVAVVLGVLTLLGAMARTTFAISGHLLLTVLAVVVFVYTALAGTQLTCDCLSRERREGTLGLLFLTDLQDYDVILGKLVAGTLNAGYGMFAVMPVLAVSLILGGTTSGEFWRVVLVSGNLLFFFAAVGMFASAYTRRESTAPVAAFGLAALIVLPGPLLSSWLIRHNSSPPQEFGLMISSPLSACSTAFDKPYTAAKLFFWGNFLITQFYGWTLLLLACRRLRRTWQREASGLADTVTSDAWRILLHQFSVPHQALRNKLLRINPFLFRANRSRVKRLTPWLFLLAMAGVWFGVSAVFHVDLFNDTKDLLFAIVIGLAFKLWVAGDGFFCLANDRRTGALELILTTPLTGPEIVQGQRLALWRRFTLPGIAVMAVNLAFMAAAIHHGTNIQYTRSSTGFYLANAIFFMLDMSSLGWIGMRIGMSNRQPYRSVIFWFLGLAFGSTLICYIVAVCCSAPGNSAETALFTTFIIFVPVTFHLMYSSVPQIALRERFLEIARESDGQIPAASLAA